MNTEKARIFTDQTHENPRFFRVHPWPLPFKIREPGFQPEFLKQPPPAPTVD